MKVGGDIFKFAKTWNPTEQDQEVAEKLEEKYETISDEEDMLSDWDLIEDSLVLVKDSSYRKKGKKQRIIS